MYPPMGASPPPGFLIREPTAMSALSPVGAPYDTLQEVIGIRPSPCSLAEYGVRYRQADLTADGGFDYPAIREAISSRTKLIGCRR